MSSIGILGGMGPQASSLLLDLLISNAHKFTNIESDEDFPEIVLLSVPVPNFTTNKNNQQKALEILTSKLAILEKAGTSVNAIACNTAHLLLPKLQESTELNFLNMPQIALQVAIDKGAKRVGLLGSQTTVESGLFKSDELSIITPNQVMQDQINRLIMKQIQGNILPIDTDELKNIVDTFLDENSLDMVVLGCTELPVIIGDEHPMTISSLHVLADGLLERCFMKVE